MQIFDYNTHIVTWAEIFHFLENWSRLESTQMYCEIFFLGGGGPVPSGPQKIQGPKKMVYLGLEITRYKISLFIMLL